MNVAPPASLVRLVSVPAHVRAQVIDAGERRAAMFRAAYVASPLAKRRDAKARLVAVVNAHALAPTLAQVAVEYARPLSALVPSLVPSPSTRSALATCHASNAPGSVPVTTPRRHAPT